MGTQPRGATPGPRRRRRRWVLPLLAAVLVLAAVTAGLVAVTDLEDRLGLVPADPVADPAAVEPPPGLQLPEVPVAGPVAAPVPETAVDAAAVRRSVGRLPRASRLGARVAVAVAGLDGRPVLRSGPAVVTPASTLKLLTGFTALEVLGPQRRFRTSVLLRGRSLSLLGGGDPLLTHRPPEADAPAQADLATLARRAAAALLERGVARVRLSYDAGLFSGPAVNPAWEPDYVPEDIVSPISALWVDEGRLRPGDAERAADPAATAAAAFAASLQRRGVRVTGAVAEEPAVGEEIAAVEGGELVEVVQHMLEASDNEAAEVLARHVALASGEPGSFAGATRAVRAAAEAADVRLAGARVLDGSGLARGNRLAPQSLLDLLAAAARRPEAGGLLEGLPVAGFSGSLGDRFTADADPGLGWVRAKTGTLTGVHGLAGVVTGRDGTVMLFAVVADRVGAADTLFARDRLDQVAAALAGCRCGARP